MKAAKNLGEKIGQGPEEVAASVVKLADSMMSKILRIVSVERGYDPRRFTLVAFGGAGPMHACSLAEELEIDEIIIPSNPGMFSALGLLTADLFHDFSRAFLTKLDEADETLVEKFFKEMEDEGREVLASEGVKTQEMRFQRSLDLRYFGQSYEITVDYSEEGLPSTVARTFHERHREIYGYEAMDEPVELVNLRLRAVGVIPKPSLEETLLEKGAPILLDQRSVYFEEPDGWIETPIFERESLGSGIYIEGPAVIEQYDSTTVIHPGWTVETGSFGVLVLRRVA
jgi:N-methylhydantoinase A